MMAVINSAQAVEELDLNGVPIKILPAGTSFRLSLNFLKKCFNNVN